MKGTLHSDSDAVLHGFVIEMDAVSPRGDTRRADVQGNGNFEIRDVPFGDYTVRITTYQGEPLAQELVSIHDRAAPLELHLPSRPARPTGGTVSMNELRHPPPHKAVEAAIAAQHFSEEGPLARKLPKRSKKQCGSRPNLPPPTPTSRFSICGCDALRRRETKSSGPWRSPDRTRGTCRISRTRLVQLERLPEAAESARQALAIDRNCAPAHYMLGAILAINPRTRGEGIAHLEVAAKSMDSARKALAQLGD